MILVGLFIQQLANPREINSEWLAIDKADYRVPVYPVPDPGSRIVIRALLMTPRIYRQVHTNQASDTLHSDRGQQTSAVQLKPDNVKARMIKILHF